MANPPQQVEFHFVNSSIHSPIVPQDKAVRTLIRKQAMKKASAARRRDGTYGKHNLRQLPVFIVNPENDKGWCQEKQVGTHDPYFVQVEEVNTRPRITELKVKEDLRTASASKNEMKIAERQRLMRRLALTQIPPNLSAKGYELNSIKSDFDILNLSTLAALHVGRAVRAALSQDPFSLVNQLRTYHPSSYLAYLPSRYENVPCLRDATNCLIARARLIIHPGKPWEAAVISFYVKALDSLQKALDCPKQRFQPEVLCATEILSIYELLDPSGESAWIRHSAGAAKLIQLRGPKNYETEFEKALFIAQTFTITTECLLNGVRCFLETKPWQEVMRSVIQENSGISDRSEITVSLIMAKTFIPGLTVDVCNIICVDTPPPSSFIEDVTDRLRKLQLNFKNWYKRYEAILLDVPDRHPGSANHDSHCKIYANYIACHLITSRLLAAISPKYRRESEDVAQTLSNSMLKLESEVNSGPSYYFMAQTIIAARATRDTKEEWKVMSDDEDEKYTDSRGLIERWKLEQWAGALRKVSG